MKILVLGGNGMAGHVLTEFLANVKGHSVFATVRQSPPKVTGGFRYIPDVDAMNIEKLETVIQQVQPNIVLNAIGILNEMTNLQPERAIRLNSLLPHVLVRLSRKYPFRLIHLSSDCVFSGMSGGYIETDDKDGTSVYAKTKSLGEIDEAPHLTIRTSIIGPEIRSAGIGLFHWFMRSSGEITGYQNVIWNGVTTLQLAKTISLAMDEELCGLVNVVAPKVVSKYTLLQLIQKAFQKTDVIIRPVHEPMSNKSLATVFPSLSMNVPAYPQMLEELREWMCVSQHGGLYHYG